jgi:regulator of protease activity HflC (stomatin/prohibitin superfamily)
MIMEYSPTPMFVGSSTFALAFAGVLAIVVLSAILKCVKIVKQAECMVIERFGKYNRTLTAGINFIIPAMDRPRPIHQRIFRKDTDGNVNVMNINSATIDLREQVHHFAKVNVITKDNENIQITAGLFCQICDETKAVYEVASLPDALGELYMTSLRNVVGKLDLNECLASREKISSELSQVMDEATDKWGVKVNRLGIKDIAPTPK